MSEKASLMPAIPSSSRVSFSRKRSIASRICRRCFSEWSIQVNVDIWCRSRGQKVPLEKVERRGYANKPAFFNDEHGLAAAFPNSVLNQRARANHDRGLQRQCSCFHGGPDS